MNPSSEKYYKIQEFAALCGVTPRTLKYYEERGLLRPARIAENGYRYYSFSQLDEVSAILLFRDYGFSLDEIKKIMEQNDLGGVGQRLDMLLSIIREKQKKLAAQEQNIAYACAQIAKAKAHLGTPFAEYHAAQHVRLETVTLSEPNTFIINYLTDGLRNGTCFCADDLAVCGRYQTDTAGDTILSGKSVCLYEMGFPQRSFVQKVVDAAKKDGMRPHTVFCEMVLENVQPEKCLFQYFVVENLLCLAKVK